MKKIMLLLLPCIALAQTAPAPAPPAKTALEPPKNRAPVSKDVLRVKLPRAVEMHLDNGLTVLILEDHRLPMISMTLELRSAGALFEPAEMAGLASVTATMLREGTTTRSSKEIAEAVDRLAAGVSAFAGQGGVGTSVNISGLTENFDQWLPLAVDILLHPSFPAGRVGQAETAAVDRLAQPAHLAAVPFAGAFQQGGIRKPSGVDRVRHGCQPGSHYARRHEEMA